MLTKNLATIITLLFVFLIGCATLSINTTSQATHAFKISNLNISVEDETLHIAGRLIDDKGLPMGGKLVIFCPTEVKYKSKFKVEKSAWEFTKSSIVNPSEETDSNGQFSIKVNLNSDFMKETKEEFVLGVVYEGRFMFISGNFVPSGFIGTTFAPFVGDKEYIFKFERKRSIERNE